MVKTIILIFISCIGFTNLSYSQELIDKEFLQNEIPKEQVYIHLNNSMLFSGEKLLYKFYCLNSGSGKLSQLSKIGWVVMVNSDRQEVFKHKLNLDNGHAFSDFFIPSDLPSGAYKILGYTAWMQNAEANYFEQDIHILNPYQKANNGFTINDSIGSLSQNSKVQTSAELNFNLNKNSFKKREEVVLSFKSDKEIVGDYSISVRRVDDFDKPTRINSTNFSELYTNVSWNFSDHLILPEVRGSYFKGKIKGNSKEIVQKRNLIISYPSEESLVNIVSIDETGKFNFTVNNEITIDEVLFQLVGYSQDDFSVELQKEAHPEYSKLVFDKKPFVQTSLKDYILEKSVNNQIENAYSASKADQMIYSKHKSYFFENELVTYNLDDYNRFSGVTETFVEIIKNGLIKKNKDDSYSIFVRNKNLNGEFSLPALLIVDGVVVQNHDKLISFDADKIQSIGLLRSRVFFGPETFEGIVAVETKEGNFPEVFREDYMKSAKIITPQIPKQYYSPNYKNENLNRIPDYRYQLWWNPEVSLKTTNSLSFFTSDLSGTYEINLEGFTKDGTPVSIRKVFDVD